MNGRTLYREYLKYLDCDCKEFISLKDDYYGFLEITYKDSNGNTKTKSIISTGMINWIIKSFDNGIWNSYREDLNGQLNN